MSPEPRLAPARNEELILQPFPYDFADSHQMPRGPANDIAVVGFPDQQAREAEIRASARLDGETAARLKFEVDLAQERSLIASVLAQFSQDRAAYWAAVEGEVVQLSLSIARKILHREAQVDPLVLAGVVRIALEKIDGATSVVLRVHPQCANDWRQFMQRQVDISHFPEIREDPSQPMDRCSLETSMGQTELGLEIQLKEVEKGLMDLLAARQKVQP